MNSALATNNVWVEKYRPTNLNDVILGDTNKRIFKEIIDSNYFPNLLLYGPPGTGKTTTIINLIKSYQIKNNGTQNNRLIIHLNASDERGIDVVRNQISSFANSKPMFSNVMKFVILDEVDYMTKMAQQALRSLLQQFDPGIRFCLICNYVSKIDNGLQTEFIRLRFNQLNPSQIISNLKNITKSENINISDDCIESICKMYKSDIRSMINYIQSHEFLLNSNDSQTKCIFVITDDVWNALTTQIKNAKQTSASTNTLSAYVSELCVRYNINKKNIIKDYLNYIIKSRIINSNLTSSFLSFVENLIHSGDIRSDIYVKYALLGMQHFLKDENILEDMGDTPFY
jgi:replication factor C subunit 3/5